MTIKFRFRLSWDAFTDCLCKFVENITNESIAIY